MIQAIYKEKTFTDDYFACKNLKKKNGKEKKSDSDKASKTRLDLNLKMHVLKNIFVSKAIHLEGHILCIRNHLIRFLWSYWEQRNYTRNDVKMYTSINSMPTKNYSEL